MATNVAPLPLPPPRMAEGGEIGPVQSAWRLAVREFASNRLALAGVGVLVFFVLFCFLGPLFYHGNVLNTDLISSYLGPSAAHPIGTNDQGYDELGLLMNGGQVALEVGFSFAALAIVIGTVWGAVAGLVGGIVDAIMMRIVDAILAVATIGVPRLRLAVSAPGLG